MSKYEREKGGGGMMKTHRKRKTATLFMYVPHDDAGKHLREQFPKLCTIEMDK